MKPTKRWALSKVKTAFAKARLQKRYSRRRGTTTIGVIRSPYGNNSIVQVTTNNAVLAAEVSAWARSEGYDVDRRRRSRSTNLYNLFITPWRG